MPELTSNALRLADENNPNVVVGQVTGPDGEDGVQITEFQCDTNDEKILNATIKAFQSGSLTPLIKEELRCTIQSRRLAEGKGELQVEFKSPPKKKEMTEEERTRYLKRRTQNREAAQRFRQKQKDTSDILTAKIQKLERNSRNLLSDLTRLREEKEYLKEMLKNHLLVCTNQQHIPSLLSNKELEQLLAANHHSHRQESTTVFNSVSMSDSSSPTGSVSTSYFSASPSPRPGTADSSAGGSDVFFPEDTDESLNCNGANLATEVEVFITSGSDDNMMNAHYGIGGQLQTCALDQDINIVEEVVIDANGGAEFTEQQTYEGSEAMRLDSCSSVDTAADGRGLGNSTGSISFQSSFFGNSMCSEASAGCLDNSISIPDFTHDIGMYSEEDEHQKQQEKETLDLAQSLASELSRSHSSDFDLSAISDNRLTVVDGERRTPGALTDLTSDLRHSLTFALARVPDMCDLELGYTVQDFLLKDAVP